MKIYFDACCISRLTDNQSQERIRQEADAIEGLIGVASTQPNLWVGSVVLEAELARNPDDDRRADAQELLCFVRQTLELDYKIEARARQLQTLGFAEFDALHLACAEAGQVDVFFTTDDRLLRAARRRSQDLAVLVLNPVSFWEEVKNAGK